MMESESRAWADVDSAAWGDRFRWLGLTPLERPDLGLAQAFMRQEAAAAVSVGRDASVWADLLNDIGALRSCRGLGLAIPDHVQMAALELPAAIEFIILGEGAGVPEAWHVIPVIAQVTSVEQAELALQNRVHGLIAKGQDSGGWAGQESSFILLQRLLCLPGCQDVPVWAQGGIGLQTAAAAIAGGAFGVILDAALTLLPECRWHASWRSQLTAMDGSEIRDIAGYQLYVRNPSDASLLESMSVDQIRQGLAEERWLPLGQDANLALSVSEACGHVEVLLKTLRLNVPAQIEQAVELNLLGKNSPWALSHGVQWAIAQGPMTRVSDTPEFCEAVASAGGLPFLVFSLMKEDACRQLLLATQKLMQGRPFGVGVLGFADPQLLQAQLDIIKTYQPAAVLLAGGRPSQARGLMEQGIATYLHVPSPGLLRLFLEEGATHFVFEGRECGGHVGPRYSFVLWQQMISLLLKVEQPQHLHVVFAGGIHDARSAAMVAAMAAPLAARGIRVGILMGSAYLATHEAVRCAAIVEHCQQRLLDATSTVVVESAPGHAIRCLPSGFVDHFRQEKLRLQREGIDARTAGNLLETMTVGRLRIATKALDYQEGQLVAVDEKIQDDQGMFMVGQNIVMKKQVQSIAQLHADVSLGAMTHLKALALPRLPALAPIAVVGMACLYPDAENLESYWAHIMEGHDAVREVTPDRWNADFYYAPEGGEGKSVSRWGGFIGKTAFDPLAFGIPPQSLAAIEPVQLLSLQVAQQALNDAGYAQKYFDRDKTSVIFGAESGMDLASQYTFRNLYGQYLGDMPDNLDRVLPKLSEDSFPGVLVNVISGRIANRLGLGGVNYAVDAACASSLTAIDLAVKELRQGSSDMVLAGGADFHNGISDFLMFSSVGALSPGGRCRSFDNQADGICLGEGVGVLVLKRLEDAERDGDRIYALIDAVAGSSDGKGLGLTAPRKEGQQKALARAYWQAGMAPREIGLVEAHGTGTVVGDRTELMTLSEVYQAGGAVPHQAVLGSVKSQIGHTKCAAGVAGMIKVIKALHHRVLPGTQHIHKPNEGYNASWSPFILDALPRPWVHRQHAAVSAFGFGGTNFHAVLSAYPQHQSAFGAEQWPCELMILRAQSREEAVQHARQVLACMEATEHARPLVDWVKSVSGMGQGAVMLSGVVDTLDQLRSLLQSYVDGRGITGGYQPGTPDTEGPLAFLFSGQGSQYAGMLRSLLLYFPETWSDLALQEEEWSALFPAPRYDQQADTAATSAIHDTRQAQPLLALVEMAAVRWLAGLGVKADMVGGHSFGELTALVAAGVFSEEAILPLARARAHAMFDAMGHSAGGMMAVAMGADELSKLLDDVPGVCLANINSPDQTVLSGHLDAIRQVEVQFRTMGVATRALATSAAFHSPIVASAVTSFAQFLERMELKPARCPVFANVTANEYPETGIRKILASQIAAPVRFVEQVQNMYQRGARCFVEMGPRRVLTGLVGKILKGQPHQRLSLDDDTGGLRPLLELAAALAVRCSSFSADRLFVRRGQTLDFSAPRRYPATCWWVDGGQAWPMQGQRPHQEVRLPLTTNTPIMGQIDAPAEGAMLGYLNNMREMVQAQRDVLIHFLAGADATLRSSVGTMAASGLPTAKVTSKAVIAVPAAQRIEIEPTVSDVADVLLDVVSQRTGYPKEVLDLDLDLEADLSIDSIKRTEIIGELTSELRKQGRAADSHTWSESLSVLKTLRAMVDWLRVKVPVVAPSTLVAEQGQLPGQEVGSLLLKLISDSTGYPVEALDADLDLEADLSIDSIKRLEIVGRLMVHLNWQHRQDRDVLQTHLNSLKTLRAMTTWLKQQMPEDTAQRNKTQIEAAPEVTDKPLGIPLTRYVMRTREAHPVRRRLYGMAGQQFVITDDSLGIAPRLAALLRQQGVVVRIINFAEEESFPTDLDQIDGLVHLWSINPANRVRDVKRFFRVVRDSLLNKTRSLLVASGLGGDFGVNFTARTQADFGQGAGLAGMIKSLVKEFPRIRAHWVDLDLSESLDKLAAYLEDELCAENELTEVAYLHGQRRSRDVVPVALHRTASSQLPLDSKSVVLLTGGARGITARLAMALAERYQCHLEIVGRSLPAPDTEATATVDCQDMRSLRQKLLSLNKNRRPADIEKQARQILAEREFRATMTAVRRAGSTVRYTQLDVRDIDEFAGFIESLYDVHGCIDGVIHGAGVVEDKLVRHKSPESFQRVFDTKVRSALILNKLIRDDVRFVVFFSSVAGAFGNRGQVDYASANDVLDKLAHAWQTRIDGRVLSVNWGPWADTGMVSESLEREYAQQGIGLIPQADGVEALFHELAQGRQGDTQVVLMCGNPEIMNRQTSRQEEEEA